VEFGIIAPVLFGLIMAAIQFSIDIYIDAVLNGAVQQAGRNSGLEDAQAGQAGIDKEVERQIHAVLSSANVSFTRKNYRTFSRTWEEYEDANKNGVWDSDGKDEECFYDENNNNVFDDGGITGQGGPQDVVVFTATVKYNELLPLKALLGLGSKREIAATTTLMNQPFGTQPLRPAICKFPSKIEAGDYGG